MASGHVNRANRPNTWLHRPATRREESPCQLGAVHTWHIAAQIDVRRVSAIYGHKRSRPNLQRILSVLTQLRHRLD